MQQGLLPENEKISSVDGNEWTPEKRFSVVIETATLSKMELADYSRRMVLFIEQVEEWRVISIQTHEMKMAESRCADKELREAKTRLREQEKELLRKDKALSVMHPVFPTLSLLSVFHSPLCCVTLAITTACVTVVPDRDWCRDKKAPSPDYRSVPFLTVRPS